MSDPMMMGGGKPSTPRPNAISRNMSPLNPSDAAMMGQTGKLGKETTIEQFVTGTLKIPITAPLTSFVGALKNMVSKRNMAGKASAMSAQQPAPMQGSPRPPVGAPSMGTPPVSPAPAPSGDRMASLMGAMKGGR